MNDYDNFKNETKSRNNFTEVNVYGDGACLYRCLIRFLVDYQKELNKHPLFYKIFDDKDIKEGGAAKNLQIILKNWLYENKDEKIESFMNMDCTVGEFVLIDHEEVPDMDIYKDLYEIFAGDDDHILIEKDDVGALAPTHLSAPLEAKKVGNTHENKENEKTYIKKYIPLRWGGMSEIYAFYKIFGVIVKQYVGVRWNKSKNKMDYYDFDSKRLEKRYKLIQIIGNINDDNEDNNTNDNRLEVNLLFINSEKMYRRHYIYLRIK